MIFLTVGSDTPFSRLVKAFDDWAARHPDVETIAQIGNVAAGDHVPMACEWVKMMPADRFSQVFGAAEVVVAHAGMGSILSALSLGKPTVLLPRREKFGETRNDHQFATAKRFADRPGLFVAWTEDDLDAAIERARADVAGGSSRKVSEFAPASFTQRLRDYIVGDATG